MLSDHSKAEAALLDLLTVLFGERPILVPLDPFWLGWSA